MPATQRNSPPAPRVSCITIFLDAEAFLEESIQSVLAQTYPFWELLLVDDGSSDRSGALARDYARRYPDRIGYLTHERARNRGMSASRNLGLAQAQGELIAFLDSDDVWLAHKLEEQVQILRDHPEADLVCGPT